MKDKDPKKLKAEDLEKRVAPMALTYSDPTPLEQDLYTPPPPPPPPGSDTTGGGVPGGGRKIQE